MNFQLLKRISWKQKNLRMCKFSILNRLYFVLVSHHIWCFAWWPLLVMIANSRFDDWSWQVVPVSIVDGAGHSIKCIYLFICEQGTVEAAMAATNRLVNASVTVSLPWSQWSMLYQANLTKSVNFWYMKPSEKQNISVTILFQVSINWIWQLVCKVTVAN